MPAAVQLQLCSGQVYHLALPSWALAQPRLGQLRACRLPGATDVRAATRLAAPGPPREGCESHSPRLVDHSDDRIAHRLTQMSEQRTMVPLRRGQLAGG